MWKSLGHFFKTVGHLFIGVERSTQSAQPVIDAIAKALGSKANGLLTIEHLLVSIIGDVVDAVKAVQNHDVPVTLTGEVIQSVQALIQMLEAHPEAPKS